MKSRYVFMVAVLWLILLAPQAVRCQEITARMQERYESLLAFQAGFVQELTNAASGETERRTGRIYFKQPRLIRWETDEPEKELLIVGRDAVWDYFADEELAVRYALSQVFDSKTMLRLLSGKIRLEEDFFVEVQERRGGLVKLKLTPREPEPGLVMAFAWVEPETGLLKGLRLVDFYGNVNMLKLGKVVVDPDLDESMFEFTPPEGTMVQDNAP